MIPAPDEEAHGLAIELAIRAAVCIGMIVSIYIASDFYPWPFDPPSIHRVKPQQFGG